MVFELTELRSSFHVPIMHNQRNLPIPKSAVTFKIVLTATHGMISCFRYYAMVLNRGTTLLSNEETTHAKVQDRLSKYRYRKTGTTLEDQFHVYPTTKHAM